MPVPVITDPGNVIEVLGRFFSTLEEATYYLQTFGVDTTEIAEQGITTLEQLKQALANDEIVALTREGQVLYGFGKVTAVDPTSTNAVSTSVVTDITTTGGAVTAYTVSTGKTYTLITRIAALTAALSLLAGTVMAGGIARQVQEDLLFTLDPYTIDGEHVLAIVDEDGHTYFCEDMIEAVRAKCVELGLYNNEEATVIDENIVIGVKATTNESQFTSFTINKDVNNGWAAGANFVNQYIYDHSSDYDAFRYIRKINLQSQDGTWSSEVTPECFLYLYNSTSPTSSVFAILPTSAVPDYETYKYLYTGCNLELADGTRAGSISSSGSFISVIRHPVTGEQVLAVKVSSTTTDTLQNYPSYFANYNTSNYNFNSTATPDANYYAGFLYLNGDGSVTIEGMTPNSYTENILKDLTNPFTDAFPNIGTGIQTATPTENDLEDKTTWYPINMTTEDAFTDGLTEEQTDYETVTDGIVSPDMEPTVMEGLQELIEELLRDPDNPTEVVYPTIEVGDSGDTPPENPSLLSGSANGLWKIYNPQLADIQAFGSWLWSSSIIDQITRMFNSPIDAVIALHQIYCTPDRGGSANIMCGFLDSGVSSTYTVSNQYTEIDCGKVHIDEYYGTAVDYAYTKIAIYLPFIGIMPLSASVVMGSDVSVLYRIDVLTGTCLAQIKVTKQNSDAVMYTFEGNCACQIPLTASTYTGTVSALVNGVQAGLSLFMGDVVSAAGEVGSMLASSQRGLSGTKQSGSLGANAGALGIRTPYLIITHPTIYDAYRYNVQYGFPSNKTVTLGNCSGYTEVKDIHLSGISCTDNELEEIERLLKEGVIIN